MPEMMIIVMIIIILIVLKLIFGFHIKGLNKLGENKALEELTNRLPENVEICKSILRLINNDSVQIKESASEKSGTSLYVVATNSIIIAKIKDSYTRLQTIAHECIHSVQDKKLLAFNFIFTNIYLLYFITSTVLTFLGIFNNTMLQVCIITILGLIHFAIRSILEIEAMIMAKYLAKEYLEDTKLYQKEEIDLIVNEYDKLSKIGIKATEYMLIFNVLSKIIVYIFFTFYL